MSSSANWQAGRPRRGARCAKLAAAALLTSPLLGAQTITIKGSDTMVTLNRELAAEYADAVPSVRFEVEGKGSETGIQAILEGSTDIAASSRRIEPAELAAFRAERGGEPEEIVIGLDGLGVYVHTSNPVSRLSIDELARILSGEVRNWIEVGGLNRRIDVYNRNLDSGTRTFMQAHVLGGRPFSPLARDLSSSALLVAAVSNNPFAIGYSGIAYSPGARIIRIARDADSIGEKPTAESVASGAYPLSRPLYYYVAPTARRPEIDAFLDWVLSPRGQRVVTFVGYFPAPGRAVPVTAAADGSATAEGAREAVQMTPETMEQHGLKLAVGVVGSRNAGQKEVTVIFGSGQQAVSELRRVTMQIGDLAEVPLTIRGDLSLQFLLRDDLIDLTILRLLRTSSTGQESRYLVHLADFCARK